MARALSGPQPAHESRCPASAGARREVLFSAVHSSYGPAARTPGDRLDTGSEVFHPPPLYLLAGSAPADLLGPEMVGQPGGELPHPASLSYWIRDPRVRPLERPL